MLGDKDAFDRVFAIARDWSAVLAKGNKDLGRRIGAGFHRRHRQGYPEMVEGDMRVSRKSSFEIQVAWVQRSRSALYGSALMAAFQVPGLSIQFNGISAGNPYKRLTEGSSMKLDLRRLPF